MPVEGKKRYAQCPFSGIFLCVYIFGEGRLNNSILTGTPGNTFSPASPTRAAPISSNFQP
jgi:hypothetical protein